MPLMKLLLLVSLSTKLFLVRGEGRETCRDNLEFLVDKFPSTLQPAVRRVNVPSHMHCVSACISEQSCHFLTYSGQRCKMFTKSNDTGTDLNAISTKIHLWPERFKVHRLHLKAVSSFKGRLYDTLHHKKTTTAQQQSTTESSTERNDHLKAPESIGIIDETQKWKPSVLKATENQLETTKVVSDETPKNQWKMSAFQPSDKSDVFEDKNCGKVANYKYVKRSKMCIKFTEAREVTWQEARGTCQGDGGDLVKLDTRKKYRAVYYHLKKDGLAGFGSFSLFKPGYWLGLTSSNRVGVWVDGTPMTFNKFKSYGHQDFTQCAAGKRSMWATWVLHNCTELSPTFMCEITPSNQTLPSTEIV